jgi:hypothetical protein
MLHGRLFFIRIIEDAWEYEGRVSSVGIWADRNLAQRNCVRPEPIAMQGCCAAWGSVTSQEVICG